MRRGLEKVKIYFRKFYQDEILGLASALGFSILSSIIPLIAISYFLFALVGGFDQLRARVAEYAFQNIAPSLATYLSQYVDTIQDKVSPSTLGIFGVIAFLYAGLSMIGQAEWALNRIWGALTPRTFLQRVSRYCSTILAAPILLGGSFAMTSFLATQFGHLRYFSQPLLLLLTWLPYVFSSLLFSGVYFYLPNTKVDRQAAVVSGFATGLTFELLKQGFTFYATYALKKSVYGSLAALPIMVLWIYLVALIFLAGGEFCYFLDQKRKGIFEFAPETSLLSMALLRDILKIYCDPKQTEPIGIKHVVQILRWDQSVVLKHLHFLVQSEILKRAEKTSHRSECFETVNKDFVDSLMRLTQVLNNVRYEQVEIPNSQIVEKTTKSQHRKVAEKFRDAPIEIR